jgi:hypothetical protein
MHSRYGAPSSARSTKAARFLISANNVPILLAVDMVPWYHKAKIKLSSVLALVLSGTKLG